jgi:predicted RNase H-like HicB family nuclease
MEYVAFIHREDGGYVAVVPDLNFTSSYADTFISAVHNIVEASELYCEDLKKLPKASTLEELIDRGDLDLEPDSIPQLINVRVEKLKRINVMMRNDILEVLPERLVEFNGNRSAYLQNLVVHDLKSHSIEVL